jgi:hypothetical protein
MPSNKINIDAASNILFINTSKIIKTAKKIAASGQETARYVALFPPPALSGSGQAVGLVLKTPLSPVVPSSRVTRLKIGYLVTLCNSSLTNVRDRSLRQDPTVWSRDLLVFLQAE